MRTIMRNINNETLNVYLHAVLGTAVYFVFAAACLGLNNLV